MQETSLHGHLTTEGETPRAFDGWVELLTQLDTAIEAHRPHPAHTEPHSHDGGSDKMSRGRGMPS
jgi:hypothetical protein